MTYKEQLDYEYRKVKEIRKKLEQAREQGKQAAVQVFESLLGSTWKAISDLEKLVEIFEK